MTTFFQAMYLYYTSMYLLRYLHYSLTVTGSVSDSFLCHNELKFFMNEHSYLHIYITYVIIQIYVCDVISLRNMKKYLNTKTPGAWK